MTEETKDTVMIGGGLVVLGIVFFVLHKNTPASPVQQLMPSAVPQPQTVAGIQNYPAATQSTPGVDIQMGGSPTYMTYNIPQSSYDDGGGLGGGMSDAGVALPQSGSCGCSDCKQSAMPNASYQSMVRNSAQASSDSFQNLQSVGLEGF